MEVSGNRYLISPTNCGLTANLGRITVPSLEAFLSRVTFPFPKISGIEHFGMGHCGRPGESPVLGALEEISGQTGESLVSVWNIYIRALVGVGCVSRLLVWFIGQDPKRHVVLGRGAPPWCHRTSEEWTQVVQFYPINFQSFAVDYWLCSLIFIEWSIVAARVLVMERENRRLRQ